MSGEDLRAILGLREESFAAEWAAHRLDEVSERRVLGRVRRARGVRWGVSAGAAAVAAAAVGVGVWALAGAQQREPLVTPPSDVSSTQKRLRAGLDDAADTIAAAIAQRDAQ